MSLCGGCATFSFVCALQNTQIATQFWRNLQADVLVLQLRSSNSCSKQKHFFPLLVTSVLHMSVLLFLHDLKNNKDHVIHARLNFDSGYIFREGETSIIF